MLTAGLVVAGVAVDATTASASVVVPIVAQTGSVSGQSSAVSRSVPVTAPAVVSVRRLSSTRVKVRWAKVSGASSYRVYVKRDGRWARVASSSGSRVVLSGVRADRTYVFRVRAVAKVHGVVVRSAPSYWVKIRTWSAGSVYRNAGAPVFTKSWSTTFAQFQSNQVSVRVHPIKGKKLVSSRLRYFALTPSIIRVSDDGTFTAKSRTGVAQVRVVSATGASRIIRVHVKDYATGQKTLIHYSDAPNGIRSVWRELRTQLGEVAAYLLRHPPAATIHFELDDSGAVVVTGKNTLPARITALITTILDEADYPVVINARADRFDVRVGHPTADDPTDFDYDPVLRFVYGDRWIWQIIPDQTPGPLPL